MIDASVPFNAVNSVYFQPMIDAVASIGAGYKAPNFHAVRGYLLAKNVEETRKFVNSYCEMWKDTGCTIMADGWTDQCRRTLINFLVYCPRGTVFLKSVDASDASKTVELLYKLFREVVIFVGPENVVHIVTDNAANYVAAGRLLEQEFPTLYWSPCAAHCCNLMLQDIGKLDEVCDVVNHASNITKYVYNHCYALHLMRKHTNGREILRPAPTRFATNFIALQSILAQKDALRAMVTSKEWTTSAYAKERNGKKFVDLVLDSFFWKECVVIVKLTEPLVRVLQIVDAEDRPAMGYLYEAIHKAREEMLKSFSCIEEERQTLLKLKQSFEDPFHRLSSWKGNNCCIWKGVSCDETNGHVVKLNLRAPSRFNNKNFIVKTSSLVGPELRYLNISNAGFNGSVPNNLGNLIGLRVLDLSISDGGLSWALTTDDVQWISNLTSLQHLGMAGIYLGQARNLFQVLKMLPSLLSLHLSDCGLSTSHLPRHPINSAIHSLWHLDLGYNNFAGAVPVMLQNMTSLIL
ncbi:hypothetical protein REPUB_Repub08aG0124100 [Reevesia pubescens]